MLQTDVDLFLFYERTFLFLILLLFLNLAGIYPHAQSLYVIFFYNSLIVTILNSPGIYAYAHSMSIFIYEHVSIFMPCDVNA